MMRWVRLLVARLLSGKELYADWRKDHDDLHPYCSKCRKSK